MFTSHFASSAKDLALEKLNGVQACILQYPDTHRRDPAWVAQTLLEHIVRHADCLALPSPHCEVGDTPEAVVIKA